MASERHRPVPRDELADVVWGDEPPDSWEQMLRCVDGRCQPSSEVLGSGPDRPLCPRSAARADRPPNRGAEPRRQRQRRLGPRTGRRPRRPSPAGRPSPTRRPAQGRPGGRRRRTGRGRSPRFWFRLTSLLASDGLAVLTHCGWRREGGRRWGSRRGRWSRPHPASRPAETLHRPVRPRSPAARSLQARAPTVPGEPPHKGRLTRKEPSELS